MTQITINVKRTGPYLISAEDAPNVRILDADGNELTPTPGKAIALCRCGASATKPFCDATHKRIGFLVANVPAPAGGGAPPPTHA